MPLWNLGHHPLRVENAGFIYDVAGFDARGFFDEFGGGVGFGLQFTRSYRVTVVGVIEIDPRIEGGDQFLIANTFSRREQPRACDHR